MFALTGRLRAKVPEDPKDKDKSTDEIQESSGDHIAMSAYLMHYFLPQLEKTGEKLDYDRVLDMVLTEDLGSVANLPPMPGVQKKQEQKREEIVETARIFADLPKRNGFNEQMFNAYAEYLGQESKESRFVRAINGLETMLYVLSRPHERRKEIVAGGGYAIEDYRERIGAYCKEFPPLREFYERAERLLHGKQYFAPSRLYQNQLMRGETARNILESNRPDLGDESTATVASENDGLLLLQRLKRKLRFGQSPKPASEHHDTVAEHISSLLYLVRYFYPALKADKTQKRREQLSLRLLVEMVLAHDMPEALTGDTIAPEKTAKHAREEYDAGVEESIEYAPRQSDFQERFWHALEKYEEDRNRAPFAGNSWLVKSLDVVEAQMYIFDPETRAKTSKLRVRSRKEVHDQWADVLRLFPILDAHYKDLEKRFKAEGLP